MQERIDRCKCTVLHMETIKRVEKKMLDDNDIYNLSDFFKVLGDKTRINILYALAEDELCVCDIAYLLGMTQSAISHQLRLLKQTRLVRSRREGKIVFYTLDDEHVREIFLKGLVHIKEKS